VPSAVSADLSSLSAMIASTATAANPTVAVHVVNDQIFALSLPLTKSPKPPGLSLGTKVGIGLGIGFGALLAVILCVWLIRLKRHKPQNTMTSDSHMQHHPQQHPAYGSDYGKSLTSSVSPVSTPGPHYGHSPSEEQMGWQQPRSYFRMPPKRYGADQVALPFAGTATPASYAPRELPGESRTDLHEM
jgi:hypothetical protein